MEEMGKSRKVIAKTNRKTNKGGMAQRNRHRHARRRKWGICHVTLDIRLAENER